MQKKDVEIHEFWEIKRLIVKCLDLFVNVTNLLKTRPKTKYPFKRASLTTSISKKFTVCDFSPDKNRKEIT